MKNIKLKYTITQSIFWMLMAALSSYFNVILTGRDVSVSKIGVLAAIGNILAAFLGPIISSFCEKSKNRTEREYTMYLSLLSIITLVLSLIFRHEVFIILIPNVIVLSLQSLINSLGMNYVENFGVNFSRARGFGSLSYAVISLFLGKLSVKNSDAPIIFAIILFTGLFFTMMSQEKISKSQVLHTTVKNKEKDTFSKREVYFALIGSALIFAFYQINHSFMLQIMENLGGDSSHMGLAFSIAAFSETIAMFSLPLLLKKYELMSLFKFSTLMFILKGVLTYFSSSVSMLLLVQVTQLLGFGIFTPVTVYLFGKKFPLEMRIRAQGYLASALTTGGVIGLFTGGFFAEYLGINFTLIFSIALAVLGSLLIFSIKDKREKI